MTVQSMTLPPEPAAFLMTEREVCTRLRLSPAMIQKMRREGTGPSFVRIGKAIRYPEPAVAGWLSALSAHR